MADEKKRIINETTDTALASSGDFVIVDSQTEGTRKFDLGAGLAAIDTALGTKVDKVTGKGLSTEDYTTAEKTKLSGIEAQANKTVLDTELATTGKAADAKATGDQISQLKEDLDESLNGRENIGQYATFEHYGLKSDGTYQTSQQYRVSCETHIALDRGVSISVDSGFRWGYIPFINGSAGDWSGWITVDSALPPDMEFVVQIARVTENPSEIADVYEFVSALKFNTATTDKVNYLADGVNADYVQINGADITLGNWGSDGTVAYNWYRLCTKQLIPVKAGDKVRYKTNTLLIAFGLFVNGVSTEYSGWLSAPSEAEYIFQHDGLFFAQFRKSNDAGVELYEFDAVCKLYSGIRYAVSQNTSNIMNLRNQIGAYEYKCIITDGTPPNPGNAQCVYTSNMIPAGYMYHVSLETTRPLDQGADRYIYGVYGYNASGSIIAGDSPTNRADLTSDYVVTNPDVVGIRYAITEIDGSGNVISVRASSFAGYETIVYADTDSNYYQYNYSGEHLNIKKNQYNTIKTGSTVPSPTDVGATSVQGFAMHNGMIVQFYSNPSKAAIVNMKDNTVVATLNGNVNHGNAIDFFNEFEDASDLFPLALVADGLTNEAYKVRIQTSGITVKETIKFPVEHCGYYVSTMLDALNNIIYTVGYYENSYNTNSGSNKMVIAKWDYSTLTSNGDGSVTPAFVESFYIPYFTTLQGPTFYNGKLFVVSSKASSTEADTVIYVVDPVAKRICSLISDFDWHIKDVETEGIYFYDDGEVCAYMKNGDYTQPFYKLAFSV